MQIKRKECSGCCQKIHRKVYEKMLRIRITFSIAAAKMKISLSLFFFFTHTNYMYLKTRINFLSNHGTHKKLKKVLEKKLIKQFYGSRSLESEKAQGRKVLAMKVISLESLHSVL